LKLETTVDILGLSSF